jgi:hypothetical protein
MSSLADAIGPGDESPNAMAARFVRYYSNDRDVQYHVNRLTGVQLSLQTVSVIRQGLPPGRLDSARNGSEPSDMPLRKLQAAKANRAFTKAVLKAAGQ